MLIARDYASPRRCSSKRIIGKVLHSVLLRGTLTLKSIFLLGPVSASVREGSSAPLLLSRSFAVSFELLSPLCLSLLTACGAFARLVLSVLRDDDESGSET